MADGLLQGLIAAACWGSTDILGAVSSRRIGSLTTAALAQVTGFALILLLAIIGRDSLALSGPDLLFGTAVGVVSAVAYLSFYVALRLGPLAVVSPVGSAYGAVAVLLAVALLGERPSVGQSIGVALTTVGVLASGVVRERGSRAPAKFVGPGVPFVIVALLGWGLMTVWMAQLVNRADLVSALLVVRVAAGTTVWVTYAARRLRDRSRSARSVASDAVAEPTRPSVPPRAVAMALVAGVLDVTGIVVYARGLQIGDAWLVGISSSFGPAVVFVFAVAFLGDRLRPIQWLGLGLLGLGLILIGLP